MRETAGLQIYLRQYDFTQISMQHLVLSGSASGLL